MINFRSLLSSEVLMSLLCFGVFLTLYQAKVPFLKTKCYIQSSMKISYQFTHLLAIIYCHCAFNSGKIKPLNNYTEKTIQQLLNRRFLKTLFNANSRILKLGGTLLILEKVKSSRVAAGQRGEGQKHSGGYEVGGNIRTK